MRFQKITLPNETDSGVTKGGNLKNNLKKFRRTRLKIGFSDFYHKNTLYWVLVNFH